MKRLNGEFDPLFKVVDDAQERAVDYLKDSMEAKNKFVLVAAKWQEGLRCAQGGGQGQIVLHPIEGG